MPLDRYGSSSSGNIVFRNPTCLYSVNLESSPKKQSQSGLEGFNFHLFNAVVRIFTMNKLQADLLFV